MIPKFKIPFTVAGRAAIVEQDSIDEIAQCVYAICATPRGSREDYPEFGVDPHDFERLDLDQLRDAIEEWEPRAEALVDSQLEDLVERVRVDVAIR